MMLVSKHGRTEFPGKRLSDLGAHLKAIAANMRAYVGIERASVISRHFLERARRLRGYARHGAPPPCMDDRKAAVWRNDDERKAVGKVQKRCDLGRPHHDGVGTFTCLGACLGKCFAEILGIAGIHSDHVRPVNLVGHDQPSARRPESRKDDAAVPLDSLKVIAYMACAVERSVRPDAHSPAPARERDANPRSLVQGLVAEHGGANSAMRPQRERIERWHGKFEVPHCTT